MEHGVKQNSHNHSYDVFFIIKFRCDHTVQYSITNADATILYSDQLVQVQI